MYLERKIDNYLKEWRNNEDRKPLIVKGCRQIGKTESILHFAEDTYESLIEINFVRDEKYKKIIADGYDVDRIVKFGGVSLCGQDDQARGDFAGTGYERPPQYHDSSRGKINGIAQRDRSGTAPDNIQ